MTIAVAISGGIDSLFALLSLKEQGHSVFGLHAHFLPPSMEREKALSAMCRTLSVPFYAVDLSAEFEQGVVQPFLAEYAAARTPNPCALCNARMKFGALLREAHRLGADRIATGHYARLCNHPTYGQALLRGADPKKDQSYFLSLVPARQLAQAVFPLGDTTKDAVRADMAQRGLTPPYPAESQEICFVPDDAYREFLHARQAVDDTPGPIVTTQGQLVGRHTGLWQYTEGQRRGLGIAWSEPLYVIAKQAATNTLVVGEKTALVSPGCLMTEYNGLVPHELWPEDVFVRIRYRQQPMRATVTARETPEDNGKRHTFSVRFAEPHTPPAAGQVCCVYDAEGYVLGGGVITAAL